jgi:hypothetical protein
MSVLYRQLARALFGAAGRHPNRGAGRRGGSFIGLRNDAANDGKAAAAPCARRCS